MKPLPIACTLTPDQLRARTAETLPGLLDRALDVQPLPDGYRLRFEAADGLLARLATVIDQERRCCRFLRFDLEVLPDAGPVQLTVTGPEGTRAFLDDMLGRMAGEKPEKSIDP